MSFDHQGPQDSRDTCAACLHDCGVHYNAPGTPIPEWYSGCQSCICDHNGTMRCIGCWGQWFPNVWHNPQWKHR